MNNMLRLEKKPTEGFQDLITRLYAPNKSYHCKQVTFQITEDCCMACTYCYQRHKTHNKMTWEVIKPFLDELLHDQNELINTKTSIGIILDFIGGEPLLEINLIDKICTYIFNFMIENHHPWLFKTKISLCTNGLLYFTEDVQKFLKKFGNLCIFGFSIDGDKTLHDKCRVDLNGQGTYDRSMAAAIHYHTKFQLPLTTKMTLSPENIMFSSSAIINLIKCNFKDIFVNGIYEEGWNYTHGTILYNEFKKIANYVINNNLYNKVYIRIFDRSLYHPLYENDTDNWCGGIADMNLAIDYKGEMFSCIRYMQQSLNDNQKPLPIGDIKNGYLSNSEYKNNYEMMKNITRQSQSTEECLQCPVAQGCGWCSAYNYEKFGTLNKRATFICPIHKAEALINVYYWNTLYKKLHLSEVFPLTLSDEEIDKILPQSEKILLKNLIKR